MVTTTPTSTRPQVCALPFGLCLDALGHSLTYFWCPSREVDRALRRIHTPPKKNEDDFMQQSKSAEVVGIVVVGRQKGESP